MMKFLHAVALLALAGLANSADMGQAIVNLMESDVVKVCRLPRESVLRSPELYARAPISSSPFN